MEMGLHVGPSYELSKLAKKYPCKISVKTRHGVFNVKSHNENVRDRCNYEESLYSTVIVPVSKLMPDGEAVMCMEMSEGLVKGIRIDSMDEKSARVMIKDDVTYSVSKPDGSVQEMSGADIVRSVNDAVRDASKKVAGRGSR